MDNVEFESDPSEARDEQSPAESPMPKELAEAEAKHLYQLMEKLAAEARAGKDVNRDNDLFIHASEGEEVDIADYTTPASGVGLGWINFNESYISESDAKKEGLDTRFILDLYLNMNHDKEDQAQDAIKKGLIHDVRTRFYFTKDGKYLVQSILPKKTNELMHDLDYSPLPFTPSKAEFAGMALNHLRGRVKTENKVEPIASNS